MQGDKKMRLLQPQQMMAESRHVVDEAFAGDIIGVFDPGIFSIGDTICTPGKKFAFEGIPTFAPEHFARVRQLDTMKRKQFVKGINQIAQEGAIQIFQEFNTGMEEIIVGVVGVLQFDVLKYRLENEYNVEIRLENLPYEHIRWIANKEEIQVDKIVGTSDMKKVTDLKGNPLLLWVNLDGVHRVSKEVYDKRNVRAVPQVDDIIYAREAPAGNVAVIRENDCEFFQGSRWVNQNIGQPCIKQVLFHNAAKFS